MQGKTSLYSGSSSIFGSNKTPKTDAMGNTYIPGSRKNPQEDWVVLDRPEWDYVKNEISAMLGTKGNWSIDLRIINQQSGKRYVLFSIIPHSPLFRRQTTR